MNSQSTIGYYQHDGLRRLSPSTFTPPLNFALGYPKMRGILT